MATTSRERAIVNFIIELTIDEYFNKVNSLCRKISKLDPTAVISEFRIKRTIVHVLSLEFRSFITTVQGWPT